MVGEQFTKKNETSFGHAKLRLVDNNTLLFSLFVCNIANVTYSNIFVVLTGANGPIVVSLFFFSSRRRHTRSYGDWSSDVCSSDLMTSGSSATPAACTWR